MKPAFAVPTQGQQPTIRFTNAKPVAYRKNKSHCCLALFCPARIISPGSITHLPNAPNHPCPPHPTDRVLSLTFCAVLVLVLAHSCTHRSNPFIPCARSSILDQGAAACAVWCVSFLVITPRPSPHPKQLLSSDSPRHLTSPPYYLTLPPILDLTSPPFSPLLTPILSSHLFSPAIFAAQI
jgi:hypothetical protein